MNIGIAGTGRMGGAIAVRLHHPFATAAAGYPDQSAPNYFGTGRNLKATCRVRNARS